AVGDDIRAALAKGPYPLTVVYGANGYNKYAGNDYVRLSNRLSAVFDPLALSTWKSTTLDATKLPYACSSNMAQSRSAVFNENFGAISVQLDGQNRPLVRLPTKIGTASAVEQYTYGIPEWKTESITLDALTNCPEVVTSTTFYHTIYNEGLSHGTTPYGPYFAPYYPTYSAANIVLASGERAAKDDVAIILTSKENLGDFYPEEPLQAKRPTEQRVKLYRNSYLAQPLDLEKIEEPACGATLNELVPFQRVRLPIPFSTDKAPTITAKFNQQDVVFAKVLDSKDAAYAYDVELTVDVRKYLKGGKLDVPVEKIEGTLYAKIKGKQAEIPCTFTVKHAAPENLAYVTPETVAFYTFEGKGVTKPVFLINNYNRPLTLSCGSLFTRVLVPGTVSQVDVKPPAQTTECTVALDGVATRQTFTAEVRPVDEGSPWYTEDGLSTPMDALADASFRGCADEYCACGQIRQAADDFAALVSSHVARINGASPRASVKESYPNGYTAATVLRTGTFDDLDEPMGACTVKFNGYELALSPGQVYQVGFK
ncbi:MAG: hypothetical protein Q8P02_02850, partial [Candidatus Micrarchaeota archaeon]|nr:hypothetical protein [Candidatus Micrarchaeota archaeon]